MAIYVTNKGTSALQTNFQQMQDSIAQQEAGEQRPTIT